MKIEKKNNENFMLDLHNLMNNKQFRIFYNKYFDNWLNINTIIMYFKLYEVVEISFFKKFNRVIKKEEMLFILNNIIKNNILRKIVVDNYTLFKDTNEYNMILNKTITNNINSIEYEEILNNENNE